MNDENTLPQGGSEALPVEPTKVAKSDAEEALQKAGIGTDAASTDAVAGDSDGKGKADAEQGAEERKKNRTREYISKINRENAEYRQRIAEFEARQSATKPAAAESAAEPTLEQFDWDLAAFQKEHAKWAVKNAVQEQLESSKQAESSKRQAEISATYSERIADFADTHPDFVEVVGSIPYPLSNELQAAIMAHEKGPEIAYHLGNDDEVAFALASVQPHLAAAAVERLASRLTAAQKAPQQTQQITPPQAKPVSKTPPPTPTVSGRTPTETPSEKLTDDEWYSREKAKRSRS